MQAKIEQVKMKNYGLLPQFSCEHFSKLNLLIGENGTGKTFLLKALYSATRALEEYRRGDDIKSLEELLADKLRWTFQTNKLGDLVTRGAEQELSFSMRCDGSLLAYALEPQATAKLKQLVGPEQGRGANSIFIPAKEVLSLFHIILKSREVDKSFGFDDTYYDLVKAVRLAPQKQELNPVFSHSRQLLQETLGGRVEYDEQSNRWSFQNNAHQSFSIGATAEGIKKLSIIDCLLANGYLSKESIIFIDELESALHPTAICNFLDILAELADKLGLQIFIASHSYFVIKKLALLAMGRPDYVTCISLNRNEEPHIYDLSQGLPHNSIIDTSIALYDQEIERSFGDDN